MRAHAAECRRCGPRLAREEETRRRLELLGDAAPPVDVVSRVLDRLEAEEPSH